MGPGRWPAADCPASSSSLKTLSREGHTQMALECGGKRDLIVMSLDCCADWKQMW